MPDWSAIRAEYIRGASALELAERHGVSASTIRRHSSVEKWKAERANFCAEKARKSIEVSEDALASAHRAIAAATNALAARLLFLTEAAERPTDLRQLTLAAKDLSELVDRRDPLAKRALEARVRLLERSADGDQASVVEVRMEGDAKAWSE